ncbi:putative butyrophilin subfamily 2 member A3 [Epinephelus moara]|uniref:putative butyrophilin subfamily 2 member A3 n=1 Tax=Epinephelus moara TaxID=300413 RepID=UPI00214F1884|nr:putative butyrophilin subfamily 2 member A3 [Epinephelus moara]
MTAFLLLLLPLCAAASDQHVTVHPGDDVTLRCEAGDVSILAVEWTRPDLEPQYVLFHSDGHYDTDQQHPSFTDRVELVDRELKGGDVSLTLKNVTSRDSGTYECRVATGGSRRTKRAIIKTDPITVIYLEVRDPERENSNATSSRGYTGVVVGVGVAAAVLSVAAAVSYAVWKHKSHNDQRSEQSSLKGSKDPLI